MLLGEIVLICLSLNTFVTDGSIDGTDILEFESNDTWEKTTTQSMVESELVSGQMFLQQDIDTTSPPKPPSESPTPKPVQSPSTTTPAQAPSTTTPVQAPSTTTPVQAPSTTTPVQAPSTTTPVQAPLTTTPVQSPSTTALVQAPSTTTPVQAPSTTTPVQAPSTTTPVQAPSTTTPVQSPSTATPVQSPSTTALVQELSTTPSATLPGKAGVSETLGNVLNHSIFQFLSQFSNPLQVEVIKGHLQICPNQKCSPAWSGGDNEHCCLIGCSCKPDCEDYIDCCPDKLSQEHFNINELRIYKQCIPLVIESKPSYTENSIYAYKICPPHAKESDKLSCIRNYSNGTLTVKDIVPVTDEHNATYRNIHCARCNNVEVANVTLWTPKVSCSEVKELLFNTESELIQAIFERQDCNMEFTKPSWLFVDEREWCKFDPWMISTCNETGQWKEYDGFLEWACLMYSSPVLNTFQYFNNAFCMLCNGLSITKLECFLPPPGIHEPAKPSIISFAVLLNVGDFEKADKPETCPPGYLLAQDDCIKVTCPSLRVLKNNRCVTITKDVQVQQIYKAYLRLVPMQQLSTEFVLSKSYWDVEQQFYNIMQLSGFDVHDRLIDFILQTDMPFKQSIARSKLLNSSILYIDIRSTFTVYSSNSQEYLLSYFLNMSGTVKSIWLASDELAKRQFIVFVKDDTGEKFAHVRSCELSYSTDLDMDVVSSYNTENISTMLCFSCQLLEKKIYTNILSFRDCPFVEVSKHNLSWTDTIEGLSFENQMLDFPDFMWSKTKPDTILVCFETYMKLRKHLSRDLSPVSLLQKIESIVSLVCVSVSIVALVFTCITFLCLPSFKSLPWRNNFALCLSLLLGQTLYLVATVGNFDTQALSCKVVGVLLHFSWLMFFFWMNICTFHMYRDLTRTRMVSKTSGWGRFIIYIMYSILGASGFVLTNVLLTLFDGNSNGLGNICYINSQRMVLITFGIPLAFVTVSNLIMVFRVMCKVKETSRVQKNVKNDRNLLVIFAKLSVITGLTWVFGLTYLFTSSPVIAFIFITVNGSQGVFMMCSFVLNTKVFVMYRTLVSDAFSGSWQSTSSSNL